MNLLSHNTICKLQGKGVTGIIRGDKISISIMCLWSRSFIFALIAIKTDHSNITFALILCFDTTCTYCSILLLFLFMCYWLCMCSLPWGGKHYRMVPEVWHLCSHMWEQGTTFHTVFTDFSKVAFTFSEDLNIPVYSGTPYCSLLEYSAGSHLWPICGQKFKNPVLCTQCPWRF